MATYLKQSTAVDIALGPFVDSTDGFTAETALTISQADVRLKKNAGAWAQKNDVTSATHEENGWYEVPLNTTDTDTLGILIVAVNETGALPVWREFMVVTANVYDSIHSTDVLQADVTQWLGTAAATPTVAGVPEVDVTHWIGTAAATPTVAGVPEVDVTHWIGTAAATPTVAGVPEVDVTHIGGDAQSATDLKDFADAGYDPATNKVQGVVLVDTTTTNTDLVTAAAIADAVWDEDATAHQTGGTFGQAIGDPGLDVNTIYGAVVTGATGATIAADIIAIDDFVDTEVAAIKAKTDNLPAAPAAVGDIPTAAANADAVWDEARAGHVAAGSFGEGVASVQGNVTGNVAGSVGSVTGAVGSVTGAVGSVTGNVGGNVVGSVGSVAGNVVGSVGSVAGNVVGSVGSVAGNVVGSVGSVTGNVGGNVVGTLGNLAAGAKADVNAEVVDALSTDTYAELTDVPAATSSLKDKITWLFMLGRNRISQTATTGTIYADDATTALSTTTVSDNGTTFERGEWTP